MAKKIKELLEGTNLSEDAVSVIQEAWESNLAEAKEQLRAELREEFAQRYEHDKGLIIEATDKFFTESLAKEMAELAEDKKSLSEDRVKYRKAIKEHAKILDKFVTKLVAKEVQELRNDRRNVKEHVSKLDNFVAQQLAEELQEFHNDKKALVEQRVRMVREGKRELAEAKKAFISKATNIVDKTVSTVIKKEIKTLQEDITSARENDFGRRIFEAFAAEFNTSYLAEGKEIRKVQKQLTEMARQLKTTSKALREKEEKVKIAESKARVAQDRFERKEKLDELMRPLGKEKRELMSSLLESVKTEKLEQAFNKYLPGVLDGEQSRTRKAKTMIKESVGRTEHTGDRKKAPVRAEANDSTDIVELEHIRKLAGLSK
jgi:hypothetical protein